MLAGSSWTQKSGKGTGRPRVRERSHAPQPADAGTGATARASAEFPLEVKASLEGRFTRRGTENRRLGGISRSSEEWG